MKTKPQFDSESSGKMHRFAVRSTVMGIWAVAMTVLSGCVADKPAGLIRSTAPPLTEPLRLDLGTIAVVAAAKPAAFSFDNARGQIADAGDSAGDAAGRVLAPPELHDPLAGAAASAVAFALAPLAAAHGAITAHERLTPDSRSQCESNLMRAMTDMAAQKHFRNSFLKTAAEKTRRHFISMESWPHSTSDEGRADAVLKTEVQELRLERTGKGDSSFALRVKARTLLVRAADGIVLLDQPAEYRSDTCLFLDWTRGDSLQQVADTAYRKLAEQAVAQLHLATTERPVLAGAGYRKVPPGRDARGVMMVRKNLATAAVPAVRFVNNPADPTESVDVYSSAWLARVDWQKPLTRDQAANEAVADLTWHLDGLYNHPNLIVALLANAAAIPWGVWRQGSAVMHGLSPAKVRNADAKLSTAIREQDGGWRQPHQELAAVVSQQLAAQISQPVMLVKDGVPTADEFAMRYRAPGTPVPSLVTRPIAHHPVSLGAERALDVHLVRVALVGDEAINPSLALCIEAEARWIRTRDGREVYSCPIRYRSEKRKFTEWAARDAQLFHEELQRSYREVGAAMVEQLRVRQLITPRRALQPTLAAN